VCMSVSIFWKYEREQNKKQNEMFQNLLYIFYTITQIAKLHQSDTVNWTEGTVLFYNFPYPVLKEYLHFCSEAIAHW